MSSVIIKRVPPFLNIKLRIGFGGNIFTRNKSLVRNTRGSSDNKSRMDSECKVTRLDHLVLTVGDIDKTIKFYTNALGMALVHFGEDRKALKFGNQKINLHQSGTEFKPYARKPTPGSADLCFVSTDPLSSWTIKLEKMGIPIEEGPVKRTGAEGSITSLYVRDPDGNLIEISNY